MNKLGGGGILVAGVALALLGCLLTSGIIETILDLVGGVIIVVGIIVAVFGVIRMLSGDKSGASDY